MTHRPYCAAASNDPGPRRALILAGGGMRVAYQAGVLRALAEDDIRFHHADGTSGGTINLAMLCSGLDPDAMAERWRSLRLRDFVSFAPPLEYLRGPNLMALGDADGVRERVFPHLGVDVAAINAMTGMSATFNVANFTRKTNEAISHQDVDLDLLVAGISLPIFMPPVERAGSTYVDAVWIKDANLMEAVRRGANELWLVWCIGNTPSYERGVFPQYVHMIELSANGALFEEFDRIGEINTRIEAGEAVYGHTAPIVLHVIKPEHPLPLDPDFFFGRVSADALIAMGYADARRYLRDRVPAGVPFTPEATQMQDEMLGLTFSETMTGGFALGETDPAEGKRVGRHRGHELAINATVAIRDIRGFIDDPEHAGEISGSIDFTPWGSGIPAHRGAFNLFSPSDQPDTKYMVYELGFTHDGTEYYLAGKKEVRDDPGFDLWKDTTTLFTTLHEGHDATGPVVGAGVLRLGVTDLLRLVSTVRTTGAESVVDRAEAVALFGRFFMGALWDAYAPLARRDDDA